MAYAYAEAARAAGAGGGPRAPRRPAAPASRPRSVAARGAAQVVRLVVPGGGDRHGARRAELVDEPPARLVVGAVGPEEALVRARELLGPVGAQRLDLLVARAVAALALEPVRQVGMPGQPGGEAAQLGLEAVEALAECGVDEPDLDGAPGPDRAERARQLGGHAGADAARQEVGPVLRAVQASHVLVVGVEH